MDNPTRWNITNSAQNIVSALVDPSKQFDHVFKREWNNTFSGFSRHRTSLRSGSIGGGSTGNGINSGSAISASGGNSNKHDSEFKAKLTEYVNKLEDRKQIKKIEAQSEAKLREQENVSMEQQNKISVPEVFLMEDFNLSDLEIFSKVMSSFSAPNQDQKSLPKDNNNISSDNEFNNDFFHNNHKKFQQQPQQKMFTKNQLKELQQNLTDYLDIIEEKLASQISNRSGDFFQVMSSVDSVMDELSLAIKSVTSLRKKCSKLNDALVLPNMKNIQLNKSRNNAQLVVDKMKEIADLCKVQPMIQLLLSTSDFTGALDLIAKSRLTLNKEFTRVICLRHLESQLVEYERVIGTLMQQELMRAEKFVNKFHEERKKRIESNLDIEQWKTVDDVPQDFQRLISMLVDENISINETFSMDPQQQPLYVLNTDRQHSRTSSDVSAVVDLNSNESSTTKQQVVTAIVGSNEQQPSTVSSSTTTAFIKTSRTNAKINYVSAGGSTYVIVNSVINLVRIVIDYCKCAHDIRSLSDELLERLFTILQLYNSKTYHLVYSAGAIQVAGLKTITTRSLVVSQRSLKLIILLIPAIHKHFSQLLPDYNRLKRFDEIKLSYEDHAIKITERVNTIVRDVIDLQLQEWEAKPPVPSPQFTAIAQHLMRLHDNIQDALPAEELKILFLKISHTFKDVLLMHLRRLNINNEAGPQQWLVTQELTFYKISSSKLSIFKELELNYDDLWTKLNNPESDSNNDTEHDHHHHERQEQQQQQHHSQTNLLPQPPSSS